MVSWRFAWKTRSRPLRESNQPRRRVVKNKSRLDRARELTWTRRVRFASNLPILTLRKYFCAWLLIWITVLVPT